MRVVNKFCPRHSWVVCMLIVWHTSMHDKLYCPQVSLQDESRQKLYLQTYRIGLEGWKLNINTRKACNTAAYKPWDEGMKVNSHENKDPRIWLLIKTWKFIPQNLICVWYCQIYKERVKNLKQKLHVEILSKNSPFHKELELQEILAVHCTCTAW